MSEPARSGGWGTIATVVGFALATLVAADAGLARLAKLPPPLVEAEDGIADYAAADPSSLVLGSSHARSFLPMRDLLAERSGGRNRMAVVAVEYGTLKSYRWVLEHRLRPLIEERDAAGRLVRPSLAHVVLVTEWWDAAGPDSNGFATTNLPARAWTLRDYLADVAANGVTDYNRNYPRSRLERLGRGLVLIRDRGYGKVLDALRGAIHPRPPEAIAAEQDNRVISWQHMVEGGAGHLNDPDQLRALDEIVDYFKARDVSVTIVLFPRMPMTLTDLAKRTTIAGYTAAMRRYAAVRDVRVVDMTTDSPLRDEDFSRDLDHVTPEGNRTFSRWALEARLAELNEVRPEKAAQR